jgi:hypothetical protein
MMRAEAAFDAATSQDIASNARALPAYDACLKAIDRWQGADKPTRFEAWAMCVIENAPRSLRYVSEKRLRAPERGWLVMRGRRGHYAFADEVRAYDLATGAAYVARSGSALVLAGPNVDLASTDARRQSESFAGRVAPDQVRELAFVLLTRSALAEVRLQVEAARVPEGMPFTLAATAKPDRLGDGRSGWASSAQTEIAYALVDGVATRHEGHFTWPNSSDRADDYADHLVQILEAGLEQGCAPARLPLAIGHGGARESAVSRLDADPARQADVFADLDRALARLRAKACPDAK